MGLIKNTAKIMPLLSFILGGVGVFAYSPFDYWGIAYLSAFGLIFATTYHHKKIAYWSVLLWSMGYFCSGINWVSVSMMQFGGVPEIVSYLAVGLLSFYLSLYNLLFCWIVQHFKFTNPFILASIFTFTEFLRGTIFTGFPWLQFGYTQIDSPFFGIAPVLGVEGLTFFVIVISGYFLQLFYKFAKSSQNMTACWREFCLPTVMMIIAVSLQNINWVKEDASHSTKVSLVQPNIDQKLKWNFAYFEQHIQTYQRLIMPLLAESNVIILPESAFPAMEQNISPLLENLQQAAIANNNAFIIGTLNAEQENVYNSAIVLDSQQPYSHNNAARYNKYHLVPFGEYVPFGNLLDWLRDVFILPVNLSQGAFIQKPLVAGNDSFNMAICYEVIFGHQMQQNQKANNADYLLTISNDAWFGNSIGPWQHLQMARMRALELGKPMVRATNTGITVFVDHLGQITQQAPQFEATTLTRNIYKTQGSTPFILWGNWLIYGLSVVLLVFGMVRRKR
ncbi:Apolipoprotein N-acyltransferase [Phocoenobacter uteri]|uniref:Apolipoprotein N-acyltransferase n=1 Tax=Phocoenobacter uteri TaxID=146806 RepID=A0A379C822_9PAST|nr:apolipoprotein N-acyltransferase [Phocoenobacter uteri]MDG6882207.1 apolipoprotein N-acyltransferase [Phocoenobacter uteri]SUB58361.1 Apolipoprotein N-acyltransferase [Phocoenobacter uteri]